LLLVGGTATQLAVLGLAAVAGALWCRRGGADTVLPAFPVKPAIGWASLGLFAVLLLGLPLLALANPRSLVALGDIFFRSGALVFGGGHVVLPLLRDALVPSGWMTDTDFLTGYGLAQAVPGPLFTVAAYLGAGNAFSVPPLQGALVALVCIFLPGLLLAVAGAALWSGLARYGRVRAALAGVNAAVVGILAAALYDPVWTTAVASLTDAGTAIVGLLLLERWKLPPVALVALFVAVGVAGSVLQ